MLVFDSHTRFMQNLIRGVAKDGYHYWTGGVIVKSKIEGFVDKFDESYGVRLSRDRRHYRKSKGLANAKLYVLDRPDGQCWWVILVTDGEGPVKTHEALKDARLPSGRLNFGDYILQETRRPAEHGGGTHWSWWITPDRLSDLQRFATHLAKSTPHELPQFLQAQANRPLFGGVRGQVRRIIRSCQKLQAACWPDLQWVGPDPEKLPFLGKFLAQKQAKNES